ncbi:MAG: DEAD/DEAH box helicase [Pseudomonadota bacterium]
MADSNSKRRRPFKIPLRKNKRYGGGHYRPRIDETASIATIHPGADASLKEVFALIGTPEEKPFQPDPFQIEALAAIEHSDCLVCVPTGAGKTWIAEKAMSRIHQAGGQSWYASPLKALSNSKHLEFSRIFGAETVGILTGDRKENAQAPIIVGTTEILRNQLYDAMYRGETLSTDLVILDEAHFLGDEDRGVVWEEVMIYLPQRVALLLLSATIGNAGQIAHWLKSVRGKPCAVVQTNDRPVPLCPLFFHPTGQLLPLTSKGADGTSRTHKKVKEYLAQKPRPLLSHPGSLPPFGEILRVMRKYNLLPAIFFLKSRADCDAALEKCLENPLPGSERSGAINEEIERIAVQSPHIAHHRQRSYLENQAVGAHHAGQLPVWKMLIETLLTRGLLDAVFATSTVAAGVNFPARTVVLFNSDRFNGRQFIPLTATEFHQMTGRAGRRGMDRIGFALAVPGKFLDIPYTTRLLSSPPSDVDSQIRINFSMTLNLLLSHTPEEVRNLLTGSFANFQGRRKKEGRARPEADSRPDLLWQDFLRHLQLLTEKGYVTESGALTEDGIWASQLRVDQPLLIAECLQLGLLPESDPALLAALTASLVYDRETEDRMIRPLLPKKLVSAFLSIKRGLLPLTKEMSGLGFPVRPLLIKPAAAVYAWAREYPWEKLASTAEMEEGDLAMLVLRTADHLRHIRTLTRAFPQTAKTAGLAVDLILREPVLTDYPG